MRYAIFIQAGMIGLGLCINVLIEDGEFILHIPVSVILEFASC